jgi:hypothetical protein
MKMQVAVSWPGKYGNTVKRLQCGFQGTDLFGVELMVLKRGKSHPFGFEFAVKILKSRDCCLLRVFNQIFSILPVDMYREHIGGKDETFHRRIFSSMI